MTKYKLEYIWLDGYTPSRTSAAKRKSRNSTASRRWSNFPSGASTAARPCRPKGHSSDCVLKPVAVYPDAARKNGVLVMCEVMMPDGKTPHPSNNRATILDDPGAWFGFEQEYFFYKDGRPLGFPSSGFPAPQGPYYTGVGYKNVGDVARKIVDEHLDLCLDAGINHEGINAEVAKGQWEFQIFGKGSKSAADEMWMARYLLLRLTEKYGVDIEFHCKPLGDTDWNGSGMHANFSTDYMREVGGKEYFEELMEAFEEQPRGPHRGLRPGQPHAPDRHARDRVDRQIQLRRRRPRRFDPRAAQLRQQRLQGLSGGSPPEFARRPLPDRFADPEDDRLRPDQRQGERSGLVHDPEKVLNLIQGRKPVFRKDWGPSKTSRTLSSRFGSYSRATGRFPLACALGTFTSASPSSTTSPSTSQRQDSRARDFSGINSATVTVTTSPCRRS